MILSIPCSPSPSSSVINTEGSLSLSPLPSPSLDAAQCRPNFWRIFPTSLDGRYGLDFVNVAQTSKILVGCGCTLAPFGACLATITIKDSAQATSTGLYRITPGDPALLLHVVQPLLVLTWLAAVLGQNFCYLLGLLGSFFTLLSIPSPPSSLLLSSFPLPRALPALKGPDSELRLRLLHKMISSQLISLGLGE